MESLLDEESAYDGRSYSLYRVPHPDGYAYAETLLKDGNPDDNSDSLHQTLAMMTKRRYKNIKMNHPAASFDNC